MARRTSDANAGAEFGKMLAESRRGWRSRLTPPRFHGFDPIPSRPNAVAQAAAAGSYGRSASPLDQRAREDRYRRQTGRINRADDDAEAWIDLMPPTRRAEVLGLTPKQLRRSEHKANRAEARMLAGPGRR